MLRLAVAALFACLSLSGQAQSWYEVEIIIFSQSHPDLYSPGATDERWPTSLQPQWPEPLIRLGSTASPSPALRPLPTDRRRLNNDAYALRVTSGYEVLWHQAWLQPLLDESRSPWIQIQAGDEYEGQFPLQGAVQIYLERFLHLKTDLWLSEFSPRAAITNTQEEGLPPDFELPTTPLAPAACAFYAGSWPTSVVMESPGLEPGTVLEDWWFPPFDCTNQSIEVPAGMPIAKALDPYVHIALPSISFQTLSSLNAGMDAKQRVYPVFVDNSLRPEVTPQSGSSSSWQVSQIIPLRQSRRMRSGELHYLDHPRLGVLARITPVEPPLQDLRAP